MSAPPMPFSEREWRELPLEERQRMSATWYRRAQPIPAQRRRLPEPTVMGAEMVRVSTGRAMAILIALRHGNADLDRATAELAQAEAEAAKLRLGANAGESLAQAVSDPDLIDAMSRARNLAALILAGDLAATTELDMRGQAAS